MRSERGHFPAGVRDALAKRVNGLCSICKRPTLGPAVTAPDKVDNIGIAAHINAASPGGPRYDAAQAEEDRHSIENAIWLCGDCAALR